MKHRLIFRHRVQLMSWSLTMWILKGICTVTSGWARSCALMDVKASKSSRFFLASGSSPGVVDGDGDGDGVPVGAIEDSGGVDVKQHDGVPGPEVVLDRSLDGEGRLIGEVDSDGDADACMRRWAVAMDARSWAVSTRAGGGHRGKAAKRMRG
jgi:hypothetical protein